MARRVRLRTHGEVDPVGKPRARRPDLAAVHHEALAFTHGTRRQRRQVAPRLGLREALAKRDLSARDRPEELLLQGGRREPLEGAADRLVREEVEREREPVVAEDVLGERRVDVASAHDRPPPRATSCRSSPPLPAHASPRASRRPRASPGAATRDRRPESGATFRRTPRLRHEARAALGVGRRSTRGRS